MTGTPILGGAAVTAAQAAAWAHARGAPGWYTALAPVYWQLAPARGGVRPEVAWADFAKETGFGRFGGTDPAYSASQQMHNPCGLKTADGTATAAFPDWWQGITAHLDHLALYAGAAGYPRPGSPDPRAFAYLHGTCPTVESLGGHWSPSADYGTSLVADYITPLLATGQGAPPMPLLYPKAAWKPVANHSGPIGTVNGIVNHVAEADGSLYGWFNNPAAQASAHLWFAKDGSVEQYVDLHEVAWAQMAGNGPNPGYWSHESEGYATEPYTPAQCQAIAEFWAWAHLEHGVALTLVDHGGIGVTAHCHYPSGAPDPAWGNHTCPGPLRLAQLPAVLAAAQLIVNPQEKPNVPSLAAPIVFGVPRPQDDGYWLIGQDGGVFAFGDAPALKDPVVGKLQPGHYIRSGWASPSGQGLTLVASDGGVICFGDAKFHGSLPGLGLAPSAAPIEA